MYFNGQQNTNPKKETREDILFRETDKAKAKEKERNRLLFELGDDIPREDKLYTTVDELREMKKNLSKNIKPGIETIADNNKKLKEYSINETTDKKEISGETIAGIGKGEPMSYEQAGGKNVNPNYNPISGNYSNKINCQSSVAVFEARMRGFDIETDSTKKLNSKEFNILEKLKNEPNTAYIDPKTKQTPYFKSIDAKDKEKCKAYLEETVKPGERYILAFNNKEGNSKDKLSLHVLTVMKDKNNNIKFYEPQTGMERDFEYLSNVNFTGKDDKQKPKILRVDDKELNYKVLNVISKPKEKKKD